MSLWPASSAQRSARRRTRAGRAEASLRGARSRPAEVRPVPPPGERGGIERYRWVVMAVVIAGTYMTILDTTITNVALPQIGSGLRAGEGVAWVVTAYLLSVGIVQPASGWLADRFGRKPVFLTSTAVFTIGSLLAALSPTLTLLVASRAVQGLGGGTMGPVGLAMVYELFPADQRGRALGIWGTAAMAAPAAGPVLGGWLLTVASWRWMFLLNVPVGIVVVLVGGRVLRAGVGYTERRRFDWSGLALLAGAVVAVLLVASEGGTWGWRSTTTVAVSACAAALLAAAVVVELRRREPLIDVRMFRLAPFCLSITIIALRSVGQFGRLVFVPLELEAVRAMTPLQVGLILCPAAIAAAATMPVAGRLADHVGPRLLVAPGLALTCVATWALAHLTPATSIPVLIGIMALGGLGTGLALMPCVVAGLNSLPSRLLAQGTAARQLSRQVVAAIGVAALSAVVAGQLGGLAPAAGAFRPVHTQAAYNDVFVVGFWMSVAALVLTALLPSRGRMVQMQQERAAEYDQGLHPALLD